MFYFPPVDISKPVRPKSAKLKYIEDKVQSIATREQLLSSDQESDCKIIKDLLAAFLHTTVESKYYSDAVHVEIIFHTQQIETY